MPLKQFKCPDGCNIPCEECIKKCRMDSRCYPIAMLKRIVDGRRVWKGTPSATQLIKDTRQAYLMEVKDYEQEPDDHTLALLGTSFHELVEMDFERDQYMDLFTGLPDWFDTETGELIDYKVSGKYKYTKKDYRDYELQLNMYRLLLEKQGHDVTSMKIAFIVRDGSRTRGETFHWIPIERLDDSEIIRWADERATALKAAIKLRVLPEKCKDTWGGRKCKTYCPVKEYCDREES